MSSFRRVQFIEQIIFSLTPFTPLKSAASRTSEGAPDFTLTGEGPHVRVTRGATSCIVPWSNIAAAELEPVPVVTPAPTKPQEPRSFLSPKGNRR